MSSQELSRILDEALDDSFVELNNESPELLMSEYKGSPVRVQMQQELTSDEELLLHLEDLVPPPE